MKKLVLFSILAFLTIDLSAQITQNYVDSLGLKQGMWREFIVPYNLVTQNIGIPVPQIDADYYYLTKKKDRKYFPIYECVGEYINSLKHGVWYQYYGDGTQLSQVQYKKGVPFGECKIFWKNGQIKEEFTITSIDSVNVLFYESNGELFLEKKISKKELIKSLYEN